jgi:hypothetical protein
MQNIYMYEDNYRVIVNRNGITRSRRFNFTRFGGEANAAKQALEYRNYLNNCSFIKFACSFRPVGRPSKSEYFGTSNFSLA